MAMRKALAFALLVAGCGSSGTGFNPPPPAADEIQVSIPTIHDIPSGANITYCTYLQKTIADTTDVLAFHGLQSPGGHHAIVYAAKKARAVDTHVCTEDDMTNGLYLAGIGADKTGAAFNTLPDGVAFRIPANTQIYIQTHWINATPGPLEGNVAVNLKVAPPSADRVPADLFAVADTTFNVPAGQMGTSSSTCTVKQDLNLFLLAGHEHQWGTHFTFTQTSGSASPLTLYEHDWLPEYELNPPLNFYPRATPLVVKAGDTLKVTCTWDNTAGATPLAFPTDMCVGWGYYFPGNGEIDCVDGSWPQ
jgi:hypothetical protein